MLKTSEHSDLRTCQDFFCVYFLCLGDFRVQFGLQNDGLFDSSCYAVTLLYSSRGAAISPALACSMEENDQVKNNLEFLQSQLCVFTSAAALKGYLQNILSIP